MSWLKYVYTRVYGLIRKTRLEDEMEAELRFYVHMRTEENIRAGMTPHEARREAIKAFGPVALIKDKCRDVKGGGIMEAFLQDARFGARMLVKSPGFTLAALLTLALGIGANTAIFSLIYGVLVRPLPYKDGHQLVVLHQQAKLAQNDDMGFSVKEIMDYREQNRTMEDVVEHHSMDFLLYGGDEAQRVQTGVVSANFFDVLGVRPIMGRTFVPDDEKDGAPAVLVLSNKYWKEKQGADPNIVGRVFQMNNSPHTVIGVLPLVPQYPAENDVYMLTNQCPFRSSARAKENRGARLCTVFGRLKSGVKVAQAQADIDGVADNLRKAYPDFYPAKIGYAASVASLREDLTKKARPTFLILLAMAGLVLLIACANVANLCLARLMSRQREMALRTALGAGRGRLVRQLLTESAILSLIGGGLGLLIAQLGLPLLVKFAERFTDRTGEIKVDLFVLLFTMAVSLGTGLVFGLLPAVSIGGGARRNLARSLKEDGGRGSSGGRHRIRSLLVVAQVAISFVLLIGAGLMVRSMIKLQEVNPGFNAEKVVVLSLTPNWSVYKTSAQYATLFERIMNGVKRVPGVEVAALGSTYPLNPGGLRFGPNVTPMRIEIQPVADGQLPPMVDAQVITPDYFQTIGTPMARGRAFTDLDNRADAPPVGIISESTAKRHWATGDPVGQRVSLDDGKTWQTIVGIVGDLKQYGLDQPLVDELYIPVGQSPGASYLLVRTYADPAGVGQLAREALKEVDSQMAVDHIQTLEQVRANSVASPRLTAVLLSLFAGLALVITAAGIAGVIAVSVSQRTQEIGIRMALGAGQRRVLGMVMRQGAVLILIGLAVGLAGSLWLTRLMANLLFAVTPTDILTFALVSGALAGIGALACFIPARRVTAIDPIQALRSE